jgi:WD40 repeat protein
VHGDEIRALAFDREGRLFSGSWDKTIAQLRVGQAILEPIRVHPFELFVNDMTVDAAGDRLGVAFGEIKAERTYQIYRREKQGVEEPVREGNCAAMVDVGSGAILERHVLHKGVVATAGISPDGLSLVSGGWDHQLYLFSRGRPDPVSHQSFGWSVRRARFSGDGRYLAVGSWTPQTGLPDKDSDPAAVVYDVRYAVSRSLEP